MTIASKLLALNTVKTDIRTSLVNKGATISEATPFGDYPELIDTLSSGASITGETTVTGTASENITEGDTVVRRYIAGIENGTNQLSNPDTIPTGTGYGIGISSGGVYIAIAHATSPYLSIYKRSGDNFTKLANPDVLPTSLCKGASFSRDDTYLAIATTSTPFVIIYKRNGDVFAKLDNPSNLPPNECYSCQFSFDGTYLAVGHYSTPYLAIYKRNGDVFTKLGNPSSIPTGDIYGVSFSSDGVYLATAQYSNPYINIYKRSGDTFTKLTDPADKPPSTGYSCAFSQDNQYLVVGHTTSPYQTIYKFIEGVPTKLTIGVLGGQANGVCFSSDGATYGFSTQNSPYIAIFKTTPTSIISKVLNSTLYLGGATDIGYATETVTSGNTATMKSIVRNPSNYPV